MKRVLRLGLFTLVILLVCFGAALVYLCYLQAQVFAHPARTVAIHTPSDIGLDNWQTVSFVAADGVRLEGWYIPPAAPLGAALVYVHGLGGNRSDFLMLAAFLHTNGYGGLLFDLRNHGNSDGRVTTFGLHEVWDVQAAFDFLMQQPEIDPHRIGIFGASMGGATAIRAAARIPAARLLIVEAAYESFSKAIDDGVYRFTRVTAFPFSDLILWLTSREIGVDLNESRPIDDIGSISPRPILVIHGTADEVVQVSHAYRLYEAAGDPKQLFIIEGRHHADWGVSPSGEYATMLLAFLTQYL